MSKSALSAKVFALYLFAVGAALILVPNLLLSVFGIPPTTEVWIRVIGVIVTMLGVYAWVAGHHDIKPILEASVYTRSIVFVAFTTLALLGLVSPMIILFGAVELLGGLWTYYALKADARAVTPVLASQH